MHGLHDGNKHKKGLWSDYWGGGGGGGVVLLHFVFLSVLMLFYVSLFLFGSEFHCLGSVQFFCFIFVLFVHLHTQNQDLCNNHPADLSNCPSVGSFLIVTLRFCVTLQL